MSPYREPVPHTCRFTEVGGVPGTTLVFRHCDCGRRETFGSLLGRALGRARCTVSSHRWRRVAVNQRRHENLGHLHPLAGLDCVCERCGEEWNDAADDGPLDQYGDPFDGAPFKRPPLDWYRVPPKV